MQKLVKAVAVLSVTATLVACGGGAPEQEEVVIVPVQPEPVTTKY